MTPRPLDPDRPVILLVSDQRGEFLLDEFGRYARDYELVLARSSAEAEKLARGIVDGGGQVALFVTESRLPDEPLLAAFARWRAVVPTARRIVTAHFDWFREDADQLRPGLATGKYDAYLLMPRGVRDEEFHTAVTELLSDWGSSVAAPEVAIARIVAPLLDALTLSLRDFLDRMGLPNQTFTPDSEVGRAIIATAPPHAPYPLVEVFGRPPASPRSVRELAVTIYGRPSDIVVDKVVDVADVGAGPAGLATAVYAASRA